MSRWQRGLAEAHGELQRQMAEVVQAQEQLATVQQQQQQEASRLVEDAAALGGIRRQLADERARVDELHRTLGDRTAELAKREQAGEEQRGVLAVREARLRRLEQLADLPAELVESLAAAVLPSAVRVRARRWTPIALISMALAASIAGVDIWWHLSSPRAIAATALDSAPSIKPQTQTVPNLPPKSKIEPDASRSAIGWTARGAKAIMEHPVTVSQYEDRSLCPKCSPLHWADKTCWNNNAQVEFATNDAQRQPSAHAVCVDWEQADLFCHSVGGILPTMKTLREVTTGTLDEWTGDRVAGAVGDAYAYWNAGRREALHAPKSTADAGIGFRCVRER